MSDRASRTAHRGYLTSSRSSGRGYTIDNILAALGAVWAIDARNSLEGEQAAVNRGSAGTALNAQYGSTGSTDTNDPKLLTHTGFNYLYVPPTTVVTNKVDVPDAANLDVTDLDVAACVSLNDLAPASSYTIAGRQTLVDPNRAWTFVVNSSGGLSLAWYPTGSGASIITRLSTVSLAAVGIAAGQTVWLRATLATATYEVKFWYSLSTDPTTVPTSWTQLGTTLTGAATSLPNITSSVFVGWSNGAITYSGKIFRFVHRDTIDGSIIVDMNFYNATAPAGFVCATGQTVTIARSTSGPKPVLVTRPCWLLGTDDYFTVPDDDLLDIVNKTDLMSVVMVGRSWTTVAGPRLAKTTDAFSPTGAIGWAMYGGARMRLQDGTNLATSTGSGQTSGDLVTLVGVLAGTSLDVYVDGVAQGSGNLTAMNASGYANSNAVTIGRNGTASSIYSDFELHAAAVFKRLLTAAEMAAIAAYYGTT